ncbi:hypothetical protein [Helicobacter sp. MIT 05-5294]|nr:hypothetical protein [Helicobacter sp. MIT 05-5294]
MSKCNTYKENIQSFNKDLENLSLNNLRFQLLKILKRMRLSKNGKENL